MGIPDFAISVRQPWAWAIIYGGKDVENRIKRAITIGGMDKHKRIAIHAATGMTRDEYESAAHHIDAVSKECCPMPCDLVRGGIIGTVSITGVTNDSKSDWFFGPWALELADPEPCEPIPSIGQLGAFRWKPGGELRTPLPWMLSWPNRSARSTVNAPASMPLFQEPAQ